jgi:vitamin-K-epoxide reductase (warfarin-sensitive)
VRYLIALLAIAGIVVSTLALRVHYSNETQPCSINEHWDCGVVNHSSFAEVAHIPVAGIGIAGYALLAILALFGRNRWTLAASIVGLAFALYLTYVERNILQVWCLYCVISQGIIATMFLLSLVQNLLKRSGGETLV